MQKQLLTQLPDERFRNLVREAPFGIVVLLGTEMRIDFVNGMYQSLAAHTREELKGRREKYPEYLTWTVL